MTPAEIEQKMDELACKYSETHDPAIPYELYKLARELERIKERVIELKMSKEQHYKISCHHP